jgi:DNA polymerase-3 subunit epsilon
LTKLFYIDLETTGFSHNKNAVHQLAGIIEIDGIEKERINLFMKPFENAEIEPIALEVGNVTEQVIQSYPEASKGFKTLLKVLKKYLKKPYDKSKFIRIGFCNIRFDNKFIDTMFERHNTKIEDYFSGTEDVHPLAKSYFLKNFIMSENLKLYGVAKALKMGVETEKLHNASYDVELTRNIHKIVC